MIANDETYRGNVLLFMQITETIEAVAMHYLGQTEHIDDAINLFYETKQEGQIPPEDLDPDELLAHWRSSERWKRADALMPEYSAAWNSVIIKPETMRGSTMRSALRSLEEFAKANGRNWPPTQTKRNWIAVLKSLFDKAWPNVSKHTYISIHGIVDGNTGSLQDECLQLFSALGWETPYLLEALAFLTGVEDTSGLQIIVGLMARGARECNARKRSVFYDIVNRVPADNVMTSLVDPRGTIKARLDTNAQACESLQKILAKYIDAIKDKAFKSTFLEPTKLYFHKMHDTVMEGDVDVHGANVYLALLTSTLGITLSREAFMHEDEAKGIAPFADAGLGDKVEGCWSHDNLGKSWEAISHYRHSGFCVSMQQKNTFYFNGTRRLPVVHMGLDAINAGSNRRAREQFAKYLEQFCSYFSSSFILKRMFSHLTVEQAGTGTEEMLRVCYEGLRQAELKHCGKQLPEDVRYFCYNADEDYSFQEGNALKLFSHIGIC
mmetsp:Transcript_10729/g.16051  ORF Transcript_10729/g.16051 Transcript_10729/m.16051 type:complete len:494 (-) Transcript_10729:279-1760(-)